MSPATSIEDTEIKGRQRGDFTQLPSASMLTQGWMKAHQSCVSVVFLATRGLDFVEVREVNNKYQHELSPQSSLAYCSRRDWISEVFLIKLSSIEVSHLRRPPPVCFLYSTNPKRTPLTTMLSPSVLSSAAPSLKWYTLREITKKQEYFISIFCQVSMKIKRSKK